MKHLSDKQRIAAEVIASGGLCKHAAAAAGVVPETISVWRKAPEFLAYANQLRNEAHLAARDALRAQSLAAVETLGLLMRSAESEETRRKAAVDVLTHMGLGDIKNYNMGMWPEVLESPAEPLVF
jgi:transposase-like protein